MYYENYNSLELSFKNKENEKIEGKIEDKMEVKIEENSNNIEQDENKNNTQNKNMENERPKEESENINIITQEDQKISENTSEKFKEIEANNSEIQEKDEFIIPNYDLNKLIIIPPIPSYDFTKCLEKKNDYFDIPINVSITKYKKEVVTEMLFFSSTYLFFCIETSPLNLTIFRKYEDCIWLRDNLQKFYPFLIVKQ